MKNPIPPEYHSDHLFLLVGRNPLPNWVTARLLLNPGKQLYLVHTEGSQGTRIVAQRLAEHLTQAGLPTPKLIGILDEADAGEVFSKLRAEINTIKSGAVGLNYTGGTKVMAVHAYRAFSEHLPQGLPPVRFSYLDARSLMMVFDPDDANPRSRFYAVGLADEACIDLESLYRLHGEAPIQQMDDKVRAEPAITALVEINQRSRGLREWRGWCQTNLKDSKTNEFLPEVELLSVPLPSEAPLNRVSLALKSGQFQQGDTLGNVYPIWGFPNVSELAKWLDGGWLEDYVLDCVQRGASDAQLNQYARNVIIQRNNRTFEIDILVVRGYQLFLISCYAGPTRSISKEHLFEAYVRAHQWGGEEARAALVSLYSDPEEIRMDVALTLDSSDKIRVFGQADLLYLPAALPEWFKAG